MFWHSSSEAAHALVAHLGYLCWIFFFFFLFFLFRKLSRKNSDYFKQIQYWGISWNGSKDTKLCFISRIACTFLMQSFWNIHLVWNDRQAYGCYSCNWDLLCWAPYKFPIYSNFCMLSLTIYSNDMKKRKALSWKKNEDRMCVLDYMKSSKIPNLQVFHLLMEKKNEVPENV